MTINAIGSTSAPTDINYTGALTPDALMIYCSTRIGGIDSELATQANRQAQSRAASAAINSLQSRFSSWSVNNFHNVTKEEADAIRADFKTAIEHLPPGSKDAATLETLQCQFEDSNSNDGKIVKDECTTWAQGLGDTAKNVSSSAELDMIAMQSLMSQRQTAVQICTNMVSALGETTKSIAQKIGT